MTTIMSAMAAPDPAAPPAPGPYLQTVSGRFLNPFDPDPAQIDIGDDGFAAVCAMPANGQATIMPDGPTLTPPWAE
jgi:hypothetical protein